DVEYANSNPSAPIGDPDLLACQETIARAGATYGTSRLKALARCQTSEDKGAAASCPDGSTTARIARAAARVQPSIEARCTNARAQRLAPRGTFGAGCRGATPPGGLASWEIAAHDAEMGTLVSMLASARGPRLVTVTVSPGTTRLRATLNGIDAGSND